MAARKNKHSKKSRCHSSQNENSYAHESERSLVADGKRPKFFSGGFAIPTPFAILHIVGILHLLGAAILLCILGLGAQLYYLDPALSPVYPFIFLTTLYTTCFLVFLFMHAVIMHLRLSRQNEDGDGVPLRLSLRAVFICLVVAFAPVAILGIQSLHALQIFDIMAIVVFEVIAIIYLYKKYPHT